jgi:hypothetical protein
MASLQLIFWLALAAFVLFVVPLFLAWTAVDYFRGRGSDRPGTGGLTAGIAAAMQEVDRLLARPAVEHKLESENKVHKREDDSGGE